MKKKSLYNLVVVAFCAIVTVSLVTLVPSTLNYLEFWVALSHLNLDVKSFNWSKVFFEGHDRINMSADLLLFHNSSYVGLKLHSVDVRIEYGEQFTSLYEKRYWFFNKLLDPHSTLDLPVFNETSFAAEDFIRLLDQGKPVQLYFSTSVNVYLLGQNTADRVYIDLVNYTLR
jgi:hypothetical protein